jgi:hypothetical protein
MKIIFLLTVGFLGIPAVYADEAGDSVPENISFADAVSLIEADKGGSVRSSRLAIAAVNGNRLDLVDYFLQTKAEPLSFLFRELNERPYSEFKEQVVIRTLRSKSVWPSDNSWARMGITDPIPEPYLSVITKRLPEFPPGLDPLVTAASREKLANDLEAAINRQSNITIERIPKPRPKRDDVAFAATNSEAAPSLDPSAGSGQAIDTVIKTGWIKYLWLVFAACGIVIMYIFFAKWKSSFKH